MKYSVEMTDNQTGERKVIPLGLPWDDCAYWWREGNYECDCNRINVFYPDNNQEIACNDGANRFTVHKVILESGEEIVIDRGDL